MPQTDEQRAEREEAMRRFQEYQFKRRWFWTAIYVLLITCTLVPLMMTGTLWHSTFPWFDFSRSIGHRGAKSLLLGAAGFLMLLLRLWLGVARYHHDQQRVAQEDLMRDAGRQTEGVWPPAPQKTE